MKTVFKKINDLIEDNAGCPFPLEVIPNKMGINLASVNSIIWTEHNDGQLISLTINFVPTFKETE